jgi:3'-5' exoribonuclease
MTYRDQIYGRAYELGLSPVYVSLINRYPQFREWSGSSKPCQHHYGNGGLIAHTLQVIELGLAAISTLNLKGVVSKSEYFLAALFHDTGKMFDYEKVDALGLEWRPTPHKRIIHHISRSVLIWHDIIKDSPDLEAMYHDRVMHDILAHHGLREYGSPVAPKSREAWLLHLCDGISARMDDADKMDVVDKK